MLELCKHYNKLYEPTPIKGYDKPWQQEILTQIEVEVKSNIEYLTNYKPPPQVENSHDLKFFKVGR